MEKRIIIHLDMDCFFAQVEERESPQFKGRPVVVCTSTPLSVHPSREAVIIPEDWDNNQSANSERAQRVEGWSAEPHSPAGEGKGRGVVSTANYKAREFGIHSAMPISKAYQLCPEAVFLPPNFELYSRTSASIMRIARDVVQPHSPNHRTVSVEQTSLDEAYIDVTEIIMSTFLTIVRKVDEKDIWKEAENIAQEMRKEILKKEKLTCSCGVGPNKMVAKIACGDAKPNGIKVVMEEEAEGFVELFDIEKMPGIGKKTAAILRKSGFQKVADLKKLSEHDLRDLFGMRGKEMYMRVRGIDHSPVESEREVKSIGKEVTFEQDTRDPELLIRTFEQLAKQVAKEVEEQGLAFKTITVVCRFSGFETHTRAKTLPEASLDEAVLRKEGMKLLLRFLTEKQKPVRLIGMRVRIAGRLYS